MSLPLTNQVSFFLSLIFITSPSSTSQDSQQFLFSSWNWPVWCESFFFFAFFTFHFNVTCAAILVLKAILPYNVFLWDCKWLLKKLKKKSSPCLLGEDKWERGAVYRGVVCRSALALFVVVSNPHVKLLPALRKLPTAPPSRPAAATSGNVGGGSMGARGLDWGCTVGMLDSCGDPKLPHQLYLDNCPICYTIDCHEEIVLFTQFMYT